VSVEPKFIVDIGQSDRLQIKNTADGDRALHFQLERSKGGKVSAC
jgi:hypothetical protein